MVFSPGTLLTESVYIYFNYEGECTLHNMIFLTINAKLIIPTSITGVISLFHTSTHQL